MKTRAAVAFAAKQPLEIVELDLEGPKEGEVLVETLGERSARIRVRLDQAGVAAFLPFVVGESA